MLSTQLLADAYGRNVEIVKMQIADLSQADSLVQLPFRGNCMNWIVGHLVTNRYQVLKLLGREGVLDADRIARYVRESEPVTGEGEGVLPLAELFALLEQSQEALAQRLAEISEEELSRPVAFLGRSVKLVSEWLFFFYFHDTYHTGQAEILRQAAGKDDQII